MPLYAARDLFEQFQKRGYSRIKEALDGNEEEQSYLDFKQHPRTSSSNDPGNWRKIFGKEASGFANSEGGCLVWGIEEIKGKGLFDKPIPDVNEFYRELLDASFSILAPKLEGIEHFEILHPGGNGSGYVVSYIPRSETKPHMSTAKDHNVYFIRVGSSTGAMSHDLVRAYMLASARPELKLLITKRNFMPNVLRYTLSLENVSNIIARTCAIAVQHEPWFDEGMGVGAYDGMNLIRDNSIRKINIADAGGTVEARLISLPAEIVIYPHTTQRMCEISVNVQKASPATKEELSRYPGDPPFSVWIYAEGYSEKVVINQRITQVYS